MFGLTRNMFSKILSRNFSAQIYSSAAEALSDLKSGCTVAVGGFGNSGAPENLVEQISKMPIRDLTIFANDCATEGYGLSLLLNNQQIKRLVASYLGVNESFEKEYEDKELKKFFSPEFRNRLDGVVTFAKLGKEVMMKIVGKFLVELKNMVADKDIEISITDEALDYLVDKGFDPKNGARPLNRVIDKDIKRPLSRQILFGSLKHGGTVKIDVENNEIKLICEETVNATA